MDRAAVARALVLVGVVYNVVMGARLGVNSYMVLPLALQNSLTATIGFLIALGFFVGFFLLPSIAYYRITRAHRRSAATLLVVAGGILIAGAIVSLGAIIGGVLFVAAGALTLRSHPEEVTPVHVADSILPVNR